MSRRSRRAKGGIDESQLTIGRDGNDCSVFYRFHHYSQYGIVLRNGLGTWSWNAAGMALGGVDLNDGLSHSVQPAVSVARLLPSDEVYMPKASALPELDGTRRRPGKEAQAPHLECPL